MSRLVYLDSSALVKLVIEEPESAALRRYLRRYERRVSCALARVEVILATRRHEPEATARGRHLLAQLALVRIDDPLLDAAGEIGQELRSLDAIHVAAALTLGHALSELVTYDHRMRDAATAAGVTVAAPR